MQTLGWCCALVYLTTFSFTAKEQLFQGIFKEFFFMCVVMLLSHE
jgi:hypothetical protein